MHMPREKVARLEAGEAGILSEPTLKFFFTASAAYVTCITVDQQKSISNGWRSCRKLKEADNRDQPGQVLSLLSASAASWMN